MNEPLHSFRTAPRIHFCRHALRPEENEARSRTASQRSASSLPRLFSRPIKWSRRRWCYVARTWRSRARKSAASS